MVENYKVYKHTFPNGKIYIGITKQKPIYRWGHNGNGYYQHPLLTNAIKKYGWNNIKHEILFEKLTKEQAEQKEIELILFYKSNQREFGYNIANGGFSTGKHSEQTKNKISNTKKGSKQSIETKIKRSNSLKGIPRTQEWKEKIGKANKGKKLSKEAIEKMKITKSKRVVCVETGKVYLNAKEALYNLGIKDKRPTNIQNIINKQDRTAYGYHWRYLC